MKFQMAILIMGFALHCGCSNNSGGDDPQKNPLDPSGSTVNESVRPYLTCIAETGHDLYPQTIVQWISWTEGLTPRARFRLDIIGDDGSVRSLDSTQNPTSPENGRLVFRFAKGSQTLDYSYQTGGDGLVEISENGAARVQVPCGGSLEDNRIRPPEKIQELGEKMRSSAWCDVKYAEKKLSQYIFHEGGRFEIKQCEWHEGPGIELSSQMGTWSLSRRLHLSLELGGQKDTYMQVGFVNETSPENRYFSLRKKKDSALRLYGQCGPCR